MNFIIPMAGKGQRFINAGYDIPKMLIEAKGKTLLEWSVDSLPLNLCTNLVFILLREHEEKFALTKTIISKYASFSPKFVILDQVTRGQAETVFLSKEKWNLNSDLLIFNIDTAFVSDELESKLLKNKKDGVLGAFIDVSDSNKYSYAATDNKENIVKVVEKEKISNNALTGLYHFTNPNDFLKIAERNIKANITVKGEFYIAPIYNQLLEEGKEFVLDICSEINILGTPEELNDFLKK